MKIDVKPLKEIMELISTMTTEAKMTITPSGINFKLLDTGNVCFLDATIKQWGITTEESFGFDTKKFLAALKRFDGEVTIQKVGISKLKILNDKKDITIPLIEMDDKKLPNDMKWGTIYRIKNEDMKTIISDCKVTDTDDIHFIGRNDTICVLAGNMIKYDSVIYTQADNFVQNEKGTYGSEHLEKLVGFFETLNFEFKADYPCRLSGENAKYRINLVIAQIATEPDDVVYQEREQPKPTKKPEHITDGELDTSKLPPIEKNDVEFLAEMDGETQEAVDDE
jgi:hypothetical protein